MKTWECYAVFTNEGKFLTLFRVKTDAGDTAESVREKVLARIPEGAPVMVLHGTLMVDDENPETKG